MISLKTKLTLGSRKYFLPESHLLPMTACCTRRFRRYSTMCSRDYVPSLLQFTSIDKSLWITNYTYRSYCHPQLLLLLQNVLKYSSVFREFFTLTALQFLAAWIPLRIITRACRVSAHPQLFLCFTKVFKIIFDLPKILWSLWLLKFLLAAPTVTEKGRHKIEPKAKHFSHCKKDQSSRPNQTDNLKRLAKITNHT